MHSNQPAVDNAGADKSLKEAEDDIDPDSSGIIVHMPKKSGEEDGGQKIGGSNPHCRTM